MSVVDSSFDQPMQLEERAAMPFAGGIMQNGYQCGMLWGAALAAGAQAYRVHGAGPQAETQAVLASQNLVEAFRARNKYIDCFEITDLEWKGADQPDFMKQVLKFFIKGGPVGCFRMAARYAPLAFKEINSAIPEGACSAENIEPLDSPVSCTAVLARMMGTSDLHATMAAGFAGGIGLSGGACGALGAATWIIGMNSGEQGVENIAYTPPQGSELIESFLESSDYEFECAKIVGRKFESLSQHAGYVRDGGCAKVLAALAAYH